ncbi:hypothetical protein EWB00_008476 [Schistosoma japonicum]|uniref:Uncharacterized protein n=1 Tax=Schistosoma japonicum TaxID=6182 RepID=A0A4Z2CQ94_SCHJA|nr:hypothetical protein EWB00_008476 [Schistosoma japonicum]
MNNKASTVIHGILLLNESSLGKHLSNRMRQKWHSPTGKHIFTGNTSWYPDFKQNNRMGRFLREWPLKLDTQLTQMIHVQIYLDEYPIVTLSTEDKTTGDEVEQQHRPETISKPLHSITHCSKSTLNFIGASSGQTSQGI